MQFDPTGQLVIRFREFLFNGSDGFVGEFLLPGC